MSILLSTLSALSAPQKTILKIGKILSVSDLLLIAPNEVAKQCKITLTEAQSIIDIVCKQSTHQSRCLTDADVDGDEIFTTGDRELDDALGGGIRTSMVWEVVGQSAAGKTQFGLQLSLTVQLPKSKGGVSGSSCYLTTSSKLPTNRLDELCKTHPLISLASCSLSNVQTMPTPNIPLLLHVLSDLLPKLIVEHSRPPAKPIKLLVIDALAELFHSSDKTTTQTLVQRSRNIYEISTMLHSLASRYRIAILVLNEVGDAFDRGYNAETCSDLIYSDQSKWFGRADSVSGESRKEASLGLVWANQVNVRIMLSRTGRRRYLDEVRSAGNKVHRVDGGTAVGSCMEELGEENPTLIRRMSVIFSSVARPVSLDYIVTVRGISALQDVSISRGVQQVVVVPQPIPPSPTVDRALEILSQVSPLDVGCAEDRQVGGSAEGGGLGVDEWEAYWEQDDDLYDNITSP